MKSRRPGRFPGLRGALVFAVFMILAPAAFAQSAKTMLEDPALATRFNEVSDRLVCQCGCQMILRVCNHVNCPSAVPMRQSIEKQLLAGSTDDAIVQGFVDEYGMKVLSSPPATGFNLAAYVMPGFVLLIGLFIAGYVASRWSAKRKLVTASAAPVDVDPDMQKRIDDEIRMDKS
ncbi:MAG TPA: cytochrome c-type biogenesis protein [Candidatus Krumholzibacteria bacterium]|nr:cytochrome c-type biogenesis protein [Candidatus Krumholzibacteria bacterium]